MNITWGRLWIVILDRFDFSVKDYAYVDSEYEIITDLVLTQKIQF